MGGDSNKYFRIIFCNFDLSWATIVSIFFMFNNHNKGVGNIYLMTMQLRGHMKTLHGNKVIINSVQCAYIAILYNCTRIAFAHHLKAN